MAEAALVWTEVDSSNIASVAYHEDTKTMCVKFAHGGLYTYQGVDNEIYVSLVHAESVGKYLNDVIKPNYAYTKFNSENELIANLSA